jgi:hypothetical protein
MIVKFKRGSAWLSVSGYQRKYFGGYLGPDWLATKICHAQDLARKCCQNMGKNICHGFGMSIMRYWQILVPNQMAAKNLACLSFGNQILVTNQSSSYLQQFSNILRIKQ